MGPVLERARADLRAGRAWKARDRLVGALAERSDDALLDLLGEVHAAMGDLPAAGAVWFALGRDDAEGAWRERHRDDPRQLFLGLPRPVRRSTRPRVDELRRRALAANETAGVRPHPLPDAVAQRPPGWLDGVAIALGGLAALTGIGLVTVVRWVVP